MNAIELSDREARLVRYALGYLESSLDDALTTEAAQEIAPDTQATGEPLPNVQEMIRRLRSKLGVPRR
jgi:hypothetical protein